jgi:hypothetical protein
MDTISYSLDIPQRNTLIASVITITAICTQYTTLIMAQPEVHNVPVKSQPAHWLSEEITALVNHMYDNQSYADGLGNFKPQVYTSVVMTINNGPLQSMRIGPAKTIKMVKSKWASVHLSPSLQSVN